MPHDAFHEHNDSRLTHRHATLTARTPKTRTHVTQRPQRLSSHVHVTTRQDAPELPSHLAHHGRFRTRAGGRGGDAISPTLSPTRTHPARKAQRAPHHTPLGSPLASPPPPPPPSPPTRSTRRVAHEVPCPPPTPQSRHVPPNLGPTALVNRADRGCEHLVGVHRRTPPHTPQLPKNPSHNRGIVFDGRLRQTTRASTTTPHWQAESRYSLPLTPRLAASVRARQGP
jgi:hypothetical protein